MTKRLPNIRQLITMAIAIFISAAYPAKATGWGIPPVSYIAGAPVIADLGGLWISTDGTERVVPFMEYKTKEAELFRVFPLGEYEWLPDTLSLYIYGVGATAEIWLNDRLLGITSDPFTEHFYRVQKNWLQAMGNRLMLRLQQTRLDRPYNTKPFIGVWGPVALLALNHPTPPPPLPILERCDSALGLVWWPWNGDFARQPQDWRAALSEIRQSGIHNLYFPFMPPREALLEAQYAGFSIIRQPAHADHFAWFRAYPLADPYMQDTMRFWRDLDGVATPDYGKLHSGLEEGSFLVHQPNQVALLLVLLLPWLGLLAIKMGVPKAFSAISEFLTKTNLQIDLIKEDKFLKSGQNTTLLIFRFTSLAACIALYLYFLQSHGWERRLNILSEESLLFRGMVGRSPGLITLFAQAFGLLLVFSIIKYIFLTAMGWVYRQGDLATRVAELDNVASFPVTLILTVPPAILFFTEGTALKAVWIGWQILILLYYIRRLVLIFQGFNSLVAFSSHIKILYICALEILPWVILI